MSRAFVRESDGPLVPELPAQTSPLPPGAKNYLTPGGVQRLQDELRTLHEQRPKLASAPTDDADAKRELLLLDQRIRYLQTSVHTAEVVPPEPTPPDNVRFGTTVTVREANGGTSSYRIVGVDELDLERNWVSWLSPIARALMNRRVGERVKLKAPRGEKELEIVGIGYEPGA